MKINSINNKETNISSGITPEDKLFLDLLAELLFKKITNE